MTASEIAAEVAKVRAAVEASKKVAMDRFERDWGTRNVRTVVDALRKTIPGSSSPINAAVRARAILA